MTWSRSEKAIARKAFDAALKRELHEVMQEAKQMACRIRQSSDLWDLEHYLTQRRKEIDRKGWPVSRTVFVQPLLCLSGPPLPPSFHPHSLMSDFRPVQVGRPRFSRCCHIDEDTGTARMADQIARLTSVLILIGRYPRTRLRRCCDIAHRILTNAAIFAWVHAYLHRKEGDQDNAAYWYGRAGKPVCREPLDAEWLSMVRDWLG